MQDELVGNLSDVEQELIADQIVEYYDWLIGNGGTHPDEILSYPHTPQQRKLLLARMDDLNVVLGHLRPLMSALRKTPQRAVASSRNHDDSLAGQ